MASCPNLKLIVETNSSATSRKTSVKNQNSDHNNHSNNKNNHHHQQQQHQSISRSTCGTLRPVFKVFRSKMPSGDPGILCFQHCDRGSKIFCLELPDYCPVCDLPLNSIELRIPPFQIPYPFTNAKRAPNSVIIRPTDGDFLHHYQNAADLHIGLTDSKGDVFEFDKYGLHIRSKNWTWNQCLSIPIVAESTEMWKDYWDYTLSIVGQMETWSPEKYTEDGNNCYTFVLTFLRMLQVKELKPSLSTKTQFCKDFIVPRTKNAAKYIALYRQVIKDGVSVIKCSTS